MSEENDIATALGCPLNIKQRKYALYRFHGNVTQRQAANAAGVSESTALRWNRDPDVIAEMDRLNMELTLRQIAQIEAEEAAVDKFYSLTEPAVKAMKEILEADTEDVSPRVKLDAAKEVMDRMPGGRLAKQSRQQSQVTHTHVSETVLNDLKDRAKETGIIRAIDAEIVEEPSTELPAAHTDEEPAQDEEPPLF